uniref:putative F-box/LRR-repeat protein At3g44080 n=1 Tax=Fragaria vesca subsp. vesca TaxID=101020 RepID=UPI0005C8A8C5|nr:PREDICTED: putative F-box/LRR-repeat protein At3g44080 [Fragaria vesca subsp. vesca]
MAKRMKRTQRLQKQNTMNHLPEDLLLHILSFFATLDAVQTSLISKEWKSLWSRVPSCLYFSYHLFLKTKTNSYDKTNSDDDNAEIFADSVNRAIYTRRSAIQTFSLSFIYVYDYIDLVEDWIRGAVTRLHASELHLDFFIHEEYHEKKVQDDEFADAEEESFGLTYAFPLSLLNNASMQVLRLTYCFLEWPEDNMTMSFELELKNILGLRNLRIIRPRLKKVALEYICQTRKSSCKSIVIDCPNLLTMRFHDCDADRILLTPENLFPKTLKLRNLKYLELQTGYTRYDLVGRAALLERCPNLESMVLSSVSTVVEDGSLTEEVLNKPIEFKMPAVKQVKLLSYSGTIEERKFVNILKAQGIA